VKEARQYDTVEEWFHALIRKHFKGNLKVGPSSRQQVYYWTACVGTAAAVEVLSC
jgi:hypothetical protein